MLEVGDYFGSYKVVRLLGKGGMGSVFLLMDAGGRFAAAKILDPEAASDREARARFLREAQIAWKINTPSIVKTFDIGEDPDTKLCYILMEYVGGGNLHDLIRSRGTLSVQEALEYTRQIAEVLEEVREFGIVHRDIKPDNIMFSSDGQIKLADLGIARSMSAKVTTITKSGVVMGTPAYMAPEQMLDSHRVDTRSDIYSLGIVLFEMIVGKRPHHDATFMELMAKAVQGEKIPDVRTFNPQVPSGVARLIAKMCQNNLARRFSTPGEVVAAIEKLQGKKKKKSKTAIRFWIKLKRNPFRFLVVGAVAAILGGIIVFRGFISSNDDNENGVESPAIEESKAVAVDEITPIFNAVGSDAPEYTAKNGQKIYSATFGGYKWYYRLDDNGEAALCNYKQDSNDKIAAVEPNPTGEITVPALLNGHKLVRLAGGAFRNVEATKIILPEGIKEIGSETFNACHNLKEMRFPDSVEKIESYFLFRRCDVIEEIDLNRARGFSGYALLYAGTNLKKIKVDERYSDVKLVNRCLVSSSGKELYFVEPHAEGETIQVPNGVEYIGTFAFLSNSKHPVKIELPNTLRTLNEFALAYLKADVLRLPEEFESLKYAALGYSNIRSLIFPKRFSQIHHYSLANIGSERLVFIGEKPEGFEAACKNLNRNQTRVFRTLNAAGWEAFSDYPVEIFAEKDLESIIAGIDPEEKYLAYTTFDGQKVYVAQEKGINFYYVLNKNGEAILHRPDKDKANERHTAIEPNAEINYVIPSTLNGHTLVRLERDSLHDLKARNIELPNTLREIGMGVFARCRNLVTMRFPPSVKNVESYWLFLSCSNLKLLDLNNAKNFTAWAFCGTVDATNLEIKINEAESDLTYMGNCLVRKEDKKLIWVTAKSRLKELVIPEGVASIDSLAIGALANDCESVTIPSTLVELEKQSFFNKTKRVIFLGDVPKKLLGNPFGNINTQRTEIIVNKDAKGWNDSRDFGDIKFTFGDFAKVVEWKALNTYPQALRRAVSRIKAKTKKDDTANVFVGQLNGYDGDYRNVYSRAQISKSGLFFVAGEPGDTVEFSLKGYKKHVVILPKATVPQSGMIPVLGDSNLKKEGSK